MDVEANTKGATDHDTIMFFWQSFINKALVMHQLKTMPP